MNIGGTKLSCANDVPSLRFLGIEWGSYETKESVFAVFLGAVSLVIAVILAILISPWLFLTAPLFILIGVTMINIY